MEPLKSKHRVEIVNGPCRSPESGEIKAIRRTTLSGLVVLYKFRMKHRQPGYSTFKGSWVLEPAK